MNLLMGGIGNEKLYEPYYKAIAECCDYAAEKGMGISVKPHGGLNATGPHAARPSSSSGNKNFGIWYDPGNIFYYSDGKLNPVDDAPTVDGLVVGMSVKDFKPPKNVDVTPGTGLVDFPAVFAKLKAGGFKSGALVVECLEPGDLAHTLAEAKKTREFLENLTGQKPQRVQGGCDDGIIAGGRGRRRYHAADRLPHVRVLQRAAEHGRARSAARQGARAQTGRQRAAMVFCDLIGISGEVSTRPRAGRRETGIPASQHPDRGHAQPHGPAVLGALRDYLHEKAVAKHGNDPCEKVDYPSQLVAKSSKRSRRPTPSASGRAEAGGAAAGALLQPPIPHEGRFRAFQSRRPESGHRSGGRADRSECRRGPVPRGDRSHGGLVNFAMHLDTVGGTEYSADYPYFVEQSSSGVRRGFHAPLRHRHLRRHQSHRRHGQERRKTEAIGPDSGRDGAAGLTQSKPVAKPRLAVGRAVVEVPMQQFTPAEMVRRRRTWSSRHQRPAVPRPGGAQIVDVQAAARHPWRCRCSA